VAAGMKSSWWISTGSGTWPLFAQGVGDEGGRRVAQLGGVAVHVFRHGDDDLQAIHGQGRTQKVKLLSDIEGGINFPHARPAFRGRAFGAEGWREITVSNSIATRQNFSARDTVELRDVLSLDRSGYAKTDRNDGGAKNDTDKRADKSVHLGSEVPREFKDAGVALITGAEIAVILGAQG
jgi:hypothetical protein